MDGLSLDRLVNESSGATAGDLVTSIVKLNGGLQKCDLNKLVATLKAQLQLWQQAGDAGSGPRCMRLLEAIIAIAIDKEYSKKFSDEHLKVVIYGISHISKMALERAQILAVLSAVTSLITRNSSDLNCEISRLIGHVIQLLSQHCTKYPSSENINASDVKQLLSLLLTALSVEWISSVPKSLSADHTLQLHQFQLDVTAAFALRADVSCCFDSNVAVSNSSSANQLLGMVIERYCNRTVSLNVKIEKFVELIHRQFLIAIQSEHEALKVQCGVQLQRLVSHCRQHSEITLTASELLKLFQCALEMQSLSQNAEARSDTAHQVAALADKQQSKQKDCQLHRFIAALASTFIGNGSFDIKGLQKACSFMSFGELPLAPVESLQVDLLTKTAVILCLNSNEASARIISPSATALEIADAVNKSGSNSNKSCAVSLTSLIAKTLLHSLHMHTKRPQNTKGIQRQHIGTVQLSAMTLAIVAKPELWSYNKPSVLSLLKSIGNGLTSISADEFAKCSVDSVENLASSFVAFSNAVQGYLSDDHSANVILCEVVSCLMTILQFLMPRIIGRSPSLLQLTTNAFLGLIKSLESPKRFLQLGLCSVSPMSTNTSIRAVALDSLIKFLQTATYLLVTTFISLVRRANADTQSIFEMEGSTSFLSIIAQLGEIVSGNFSSHVLLQFIFEITAKLQDPKTLHQIDDGLALDILDKVISELPEGAQLLNTFEKDITCLELISNSLLSKGLKITDEKPNGLVEQLGLLLKQCVGNAPFAQNLKSRANKKTGSAPSMAQANAVSSECSPSVAAPSVSTTVMSIKVWNMLIKWHQPTVCLSGNTGDRDDEACRIGATAQDGAISQYLVSAMVALRSLPNALSCGAVSRLDQGEFLPSTSQLLLNTTFVSDVRFLFHALGLYGHLGDQVELLHLVHELTSSSASTLGNLCTMLQDLQMCSAVQHALLGSYVWRVSHANKAVLGTHQIPPSTGASLSGTVDEHLQWLLKVNSTNELAQSVIDNVICAYRSMETADRLSTITQKSTTKNYDSLGEVLLGLLEAKGKSKTDGVQARDNYRVLRVWVALLSAKALLMLCGDHRRALSWSRRVISLTAQSNGIQRVALDMIGLRLEALLLISEINEQCGLVESALTYLSEAMATARLGSKACMSIVGLHGLRIWYRLDSSRLLTSMSELLGTAACTPNTMDEISLAVRFVVTRLAIFLGIDLDDDVLLLGQQGFDGLGTKRFSVGDLEASLRFRYLSSYWNTFNQPPPLGSESVERRRKYDTCLRDIDRKDILDIHRSIENFIFTKPIVKISSTRTTTIYSAVKTSITASDVCLNFDVRRDLRRFRCFHNTIGSARNNWCTFLAGASSCNTASENLAHLDGHSTSATGTESSSNPLRHMNEASTLIFKALSAEDDSVEAVAKISTLLEAVIQPVGDGVPTVSGVCYLAVEPFTHNLLIGRYERHLVLTAALPVANKVRLFLDEWKQLMEENDLVLRRTKDIKQVQKWSERDKQQWWDDRNACDQSVARQLQEFEGLLGPFRCMLWPACTETEPLTKDLSSMGEVIVQQLGMLSMNGTKRGRIAIDEDDSAAAVQELVKQPGIVAWARYVARAMRSEYAPASSIPLSQTEALEAMLGGIPIELCNGDYRLSIAEQLLQEASKDLPTADAAIATVADCSSQSKELDYETMTVAELRKLLKDMDLPITGKKAELVDRIRRAHQSANATANHNISSSRKDSRAIKSAACFNHMLLILDENLQSIPLECMPSLKSIPCSRVPGLAVLLSMILHRQSSLPQTKLKSQLDISKTWYVIDPESNLPETRMTMMKFFEPYTSRWKWAGFASCIPPESDVRTNHESSDLFIYCGHGAGEKLVNSSRMRKSRTPAALLWGCSSGKLSTPGVHDAAGSALNYLLGGAQFVVGNLWDVTDRDIDKYSMHCMSQVLPCSAVAASNSSNNIRLLPTESAVPLGAGLANSRSVCKLQYVVGCAPVMYGLPVEIGSQFA